MSSTSSAISVELSNAEQSTSAARIGSGSAEHQSVAAGIGNRVAISTAVAIGVPSSPPRQVSTRAEGPIWPASQDSALDLPIPASPSRTCTSPPPERAWAHARVSRLPSSVRHAKPAIGRQAIPDQAARPPGQRPPTTSQVSWPSGPPAVTLTGRVSPRRSAASHSNDSPTATTLSPSPQVTVTANP